jgi:hypothetical protein
LKSVAEAAADYHSVADPGCLSRILIFSHPGSRIPDPKQQQKRGGGGIKCHAFLSSHKFHKIENYLCFEVLKTKIWANFKRFIELFTQKIVTKLPKIWVWDPRSGSGKKPIQDPGSGFRGQKGTGSGIRISKTGLSVGVYFTYYITSHISTVLYTFLSTNVMIVQF